MRTMQNQTFDAERALYGSKGILVKNCSFDGPADGESAFKECKDVQVEHSFFNLRYPFWHDHGLVIRDSEMTQACRAALWYSDHITIENTQLHGIKALRECADVKMAGCDVVPRSLAGLSGVWNGRLRRRERILHDALHRPALYKRTHEGQIFLPVHREFCF